MPGHDAKTWRSTPAIQHRTYVRCAFNGNSAAIEGAPYVQVRPFAPSQRDEAMAWVSQPPDTAENDRSEPSPGPTRSVRLIKTTRPELVAFEVDGKITREDVGDLIAAFDEAMKAHERIRALVRVRGFDGVTRDALRHEGLWSVKMRGLRQVERYALVGGPAWMETVAGWLTPVVPIKTRHFAESEEAAAWDWLGAKPSAPRLP